MIPYRWWRCHEIGYGVIFGEYFRSKINKNRWETFVFWPLVMDLQHGGCFFFYCPICRFNGHGVKCNFPTCSTSLWDRVPVKPRMFCGRLKVTGRLKDTIIKRPCYYNIISLSRQCHYRCYNVNGHHTMKIFRTFIRTTHMDLQTVSFR